MSAGRPSQARLLYTRALQVAEARGAPVARATADLHVGLSEIDREAGDVESATGHLERAAALSGRAPLAETRYRWYVAKSQVAESAGQVEEAVTLLDTAEQLYRPGFFPDVRPIAAMRARIWIAQGDLTRAAGWAAARGVSVADDARFLREFDHLTLVRLLIASHRMHPDTGTLDQALDQLHRLREAAEISGRAGSLLEIRLLQALAHDAQGDRPRALATLGEAWAEALEPERYVRLFLDEGAPMVALLRDAQQRDAVSDHATRLLSHGTALDGAPVGTGQRVAPRVAERLADPLSDREVQVIRLLDTELSGPQIARELFISHNTLRTHTKHIFTKLDVSSRQAAVRRAREAGLL